VTDGLGQYAQVCTTIATPSIPIAVDDYYVGEYNKTLTVDAANNVLLNDQPSDNPGAVACVVNITADTPAPDGSLNILSMCGGTFEFTPAPLFSGNTSFTYEIRDNVSSVATRANVYIYIPPEPPCVVALNDSFTGVFNQPYSPPSAALILANDDSCSQSPQLEVVWAGYVSVGSGVLTSWSPNGSFIFTPTADWSGTTVFPYRIVDRANGLNATAYVHITILPPNQSCVVAMNNSYTGVYNTPFSPSTGQLILANDDSCSQSPQLEVVAAGPVSVGSGVLTSWSPNGSFIFTPTADWSGTTVFPYRIVDRANGLNATAYVHISFNPSYTLTPANYTYKAPYNAPFSPVDHSALLLSSVQASNPAAQLSVVRVTTSPQNGTVVVDASGDFTFTPDPDWYGEFCRGRRAH